MTSSVPITCHSVTWLVAPVCLMSVPVNHCGTPPSMRWAHTQLAKKAHMQNPTSVPHVAHKAGLSYVVGTYCTPNSTLDTDCQAWRRWVPYLSSVVYSTSDITLTSQSQCRHSNHKANEPVNACVQSDICWSTDWRGRMGKDRQKDRQKEFSSFHILFFYMELVCNNTVG